MVKKKQGLIATVQVAVFCECGMSMEHHVQFVRCPNRACPHFGEKWEAPRFELQPFVEKDRDPNGSP